jgi:hypothetical protein
MVRGVADRPNGAEGHTATGPVIGPVVDCHTPATHFTNREKTTGMTIVMTTILNRSPQPDGRLLLMDTIVGMPGGMRGMR